MKVKQIRTIPFRIPLKKATVWARGKIDAAEHMLVLVDTDEGVTGIAEAPPRPSIYGESLASIKFAIDKWLSPVVVGCDPMEIEKIWDRFDYIAGNNTAKAAIDIALYDIIGKAFQVPCYKLNGYWTDKVKMSWCVNLNPIKEMVEEGQKMIDDHGIKTLKLKIGMDPKKDVEMVKTIRQELGDEVSLYVDANQGYDPFTAVRVVEDMMAYNIQMVEEPCLIWDKKGRKMVADRISIPIMGDESCLTPVEVMREIELETVRVVNIKPARTGFTLSRKIVDICETAGVPNLLGFQGDSSVGSIASAHLCASYKNTSCYYPSEASFFMHLSDDFVKEPPVVKDGFLELGDKPGLGIEIDETKLKQFALN